MPYYKTIDELINSFGTTQRKSLNSDISQSRYDAVKQIADGGYKPMDYSWDGEKPSVPVSTYERPRDTNVADVYRQVSVENRLQDREVKDFNTIRKPVTFENRIKSATAYQQSSLSEGVTYVTKSLANIPDAAFLTASMATNVVWNPIAKALGLRQLENKTLTKAVTDVVQQAAGARQIDTSTIKSTAVKNVVNDINQGNNVLTGLIQRSGEYYAGIQNRESKNVSKAEKVIGLVQKSLPQTALMALPYGNLVFGASAIGGNLADVTVGGKAKTKDVGKALVNAEIEIATEMIFGLFKNSGALVEGALANTLGKAVKPTVGMLVKSVLLNATEEGAEELIAFPFSTLVDWLYDNPEKKITDYANWETAKKWGEAGLVGFLSGALLSSGTAIRSGMLSKQEARRLEVLSDRLKDTPVEELSEAEVQEVVELTAKGMEGVSPELVEDTLPPVQQIIDELTARNEAAVQAQPIPERTMPTEAPVEPVEAPAPQEVATDMSVPQKAVEAPVESVELSSDTVDQYVESKVVKGTSEDLKTLKGQSRTALHSNNNSDKLENLGYFEDLGSVKWLANNTKIELENNKMNEDNEYTHFTKLTAEMGSSRKSRVYLSPLKISNNVIGGVMGEHLKEHSPQNIIAVSKLADEMTKNGFVDGENDFSIMVYVDSLGQGYIAEGNHRIKAAILAGIDKVPLVIKYWQSAPLTDGFWKPDNIAKLQPRASKVVPVKQISAQEKEPVSNTQTSVPEPQPIPKKANKQPTTVKKPVSKESLLARKARYQKRLQNPLNDADKQDIQNQITKIDKQLAKLEGTKKANRQTPAEAKAASAKVVAEESQKQDMSETSGAIAGSMAMPVTNETWRATESEDTRRAREMAREPIEGNTLWQKLKKFARELKPRVAYGAVPIDPNKYGDVRRAWRLVQRSGIISKNEATKLLVDIYKPVSSNHIELMEAAILYLDIAEDINRGLYTSHEELLRFNIKSLSDAMRTAEAIKNDLEAPGNLDVKEAIARRRKLMDTVRNRLIANAAVTGIPMEHIKARSDYMYHAILDYHAEFGGDKAQKGKSRIDYKGRLGSLHDYVSNPVYADFMILTKMSKDILKLDLYNEIKKFDVSKQIETPEESDWELPDGYSEIDPSFLGVKEYDVHSKQMKLAIEYKALDDAGITRDSLEGKRRLIRAAKRANTMVMVVPTEIAESLESEFGKKESKESWFNKGSTKLMNIWKYSRLRLPGFVLKYNTRNLFGDLDAVFTSRPTFLLGVPKFGYELYKYYYNKSNPLTEELAQYVMRSGLTTGQTVTEMASLKSSKQLQFLSNSNAPKDVAVKSVKKLWSMLTMETATDFREQVLRYVAYRGFLAEMSRRDSKLPKDFSASIPGEIKTIADVRDRAAKMSNDLLGAYDDVSLLGQGVAKHIVPFFRFKEVNMKRYFRMMKNSFRGDPELVYKTGQRLVNTLGTGARIGAVGLLKFSRLAVLVGAYYGAINLFNHLIAPDEEEELSAQAKSSPHLTMPRSLTGGNRIYYLDRLGSFADLANIVGIDLEFGKDLQDIVSGKMTLKQKFDKMKTSPVDEFINSSVPLLKIALALFKGKEYYPDVTNPSTIYDGWQYVMDTLGMGDEWKAISRSSKPQAMVEGSYFKQKRNILFNSILPGDAAVYDTRDMLDEFYEKNNLPKWDAGENLNPMSMEYKRSSAAYNYRLALKLDDTQSAQYYLMQYAAAGGTQATFKASLQATYPAQFMKKEYKKMFLAQLTDEERTIYNRANSWIDQIIAEAEKDISKLPKK